MLVLLNFAVPFYPASLVSMTGILIHPSTGPSHKEAGKLLQCKFTYMYARFLGDPSLLLVYVLFTFAGSTVAGVVVGVVVGILLIVSLLMSVCVAVAVIYRKRGKLPLSVPNDHRMYIVIIFVC